MFVSCHIGARGGDREWPINEKFEKTTTSILIDADKESMDLLKKTNQGKENEYIYSYAVGENAGSCNLYHTLSPYLTSTLKPKQTSEDWNLFWFGTDYVLKEAGEIKKTENIQQYSLNDLYLGPLKNIPKPDFLSLDTQGNELHIIQGLGDLLEQNIIGLVSEVEFHELYDSQPLFGEVCSFLNKKNFYFVGFNNMIQVSPFRCPIGLRGRGFDFTANALFLRKPDKVFSESSKKTLKLAFCAAILNTFEITWRCLDLLDAKKFFETFKPEDIQEEFLIDLHKAYQQAPKVFPPTVKEEIEGKKDLSWKKEKWKFKDNKIGLVLEKYGLKSQASFLKNICEKAFI